MTATPTRCHHTDTLLRSATRRTPRVLSRPCSSRMTAKISMVCTGLASMPKRSVRKALVKNAAPKSTPAVTATWPRKLNQPVNQLHAAPRLRLSLAAQ